jgi:predicted  nucleic acid-binding Zn-ribbon protein
MVGKIKTLFEKAKIIFSQTPRGSELRTAWAGLSVGALAFGALVHDADQAAAARAAAQAQEAQYATLDAAHTALRDKATKLKRQLRDTQKQADTTRGNLTTLQRRHDDLNKDYAALQDELNALEKQLAAATAALGETSEENAQRRDENEALSRQHETLEGDNARLQENLGAQSFQLGELGRKLVDLSAQHLELGGEKDSLKQKLGALSAQYLELEEAHTVAQREIEEAARRASMQEARLTVAMAQVIAQGLLVQQQQRELGKAEIQIRLAQQTKPVLNFPAPTEGFAERNRRYSWPEQTKYAVPSIRLIVNGEPFFSSGLALDGKTVVFSAPTQEFTEMTARFGDQDEILLTNIHINPDFGIGIGTLSPDAKKPTSTPVYEWEQNKSPPPLIKENDALLMVGWGGEFLFHATDARMGRLNPSVTAPQGTFSCKFGGETLLPAIGPSNSYFTPEGKFVGFAGTPAAVILEMWKSYDPEGSARAGITEERLEQQRAVWPHFPESCRKSLDKFFQLTP